MHEGKLRLRLRDKLGTVHSVIVEKRTGHAALSLGGFLGVGQKYIPSWGRRLGRPATLVAQIQKHLDLQSYFVALDCGFTPSAANHRR